MRAREQRSTRGEGSGCPTPGAQRGEHGLGEGNGGDDGPS